MACRGETLTSHDIPQVDEAVSPSSGQEAAVGAKTNSIDLGKVGILWGKGEVGAPGLRHTGVYSQALCHVSVHTRGSCYLCLDPCSNLYPYYPIFP